MSKTLDYLKKIQAQREGSRNSLPATPPKKDDTRENKEQIKYTMSLNKQSPAPKRFPINKLVYLIFGFFVLLNLGFNATLFLLINSYASERNNAILILAKIEKQLDTNTKKINTASTSIKKINDAVTSINSKIKDTAQKVSKLEKDFTKDRESLSFNIENLTKVKNTMLNKIGSLEAKIEELKISKQQ